MEVTSKEISEELYRLSGWEDTYWWAANLDGFHKEPTTTPVFPERSIPAYSLGFLIRKLPVSRRKEFGSSKLRFRHYYLDVTAAHSTGGWVAGYRIMAAKAYERNWFADANADTPEDAVALLAIKLIKEGVIK